MDELKLPYFSAAIPKETELRTWVQTVLKSTFGHRWDQQRLNIKIKLIHHNRRIYNRRSFLKLSLLQFLADLRRSAGGDGQRSPELDLTRSNIDLYSYMKYITIVFIYLPDPFILYTLNHIYICPGLALSSGSRQGKGRLAKRLTPGTINNHKNKHKITQSTNTNTI